MAVPTTRKEFKEFCLRKIGKPVIEINVDDDQVEDRIDEALQFYWDYHYDGTEKLYMTYQMTSNDIATNSISIPENVIGVTHIFPFTTHTVSAQEFSPTYNMIFDMTFNYPGYGLLTHYMTLEQMSFMDDIISGKTPIRYNRHRNVLHIDGDGHNLREGSYIIAVCYQVVDPEEFQDVWKDRWLQNYATLKITEQWGVNITKFSGMMLPGNVTFNGDKILDDARNEIRRMEEEVVYNHSLPISDFIG